MSRTGGNFAIRGVKGQTIFPYFPKIYTLHLCPLKDNPVIGLDPKLIPLDDKIAIQQKSDNLRSIKVIWLYLIF